VFERWYGSALFDPVFFWIGGAVFVVALATRMPFLQGFLVLGAFEILADATLTGPWSPVPSVPALAASVPVLFVILGDARFFVLVTRARRGRLDGRALLGAAALAFVVPVASYIPQLAFPTAFASPRNVFLLYEAMFLAFATALRVWLPSRLPDASRRWILRVAELEIAQYTLWIVADLVIVSGADAGYLLRLVPNAIYYVFFLPFVAWTAPRDLAEPWSRARA
jgi:hypothetical protein